MQKFNMYNIWMLILAGFSLIFLVSGLKFLMLDYKVMFEWYLLSINSMGICYLIYLDWLSLLFSFVVFFISSMVLIYSSVYMGTYNFSSIRFMMLVLVFVFSMLLMINSPNLISIMLGWDGLGLVSYCLVIYYSSMKSYLAGMVTCLTNRLGDIGLLISISWMLSYGSWNFIFYLDFFSTKLYFLVVLSSFTKSAQIPFSVWLPAAMAAPTPVSALVHSSTLVTAGVYLLIRFYSSLFLEMKLFLFMSFCTMIMSSLVANYEFDLKKIIALSTLSQLGLMMSCLFQGLSDLAFFHLLTHAMFKSLLFLCAGVIIHMMSGNQDIRVMGSICLSMPLTSCCFNISNMALCGMPFLSGFYSKDMVLECLSFEGTNMFILTVFYMSLAMTSLYSIRLMYYSLMTNYLSSSYTNIGDYLFEMKYSIMFLSLNSIYFGCSFIWLIDLNLLYIMLPMYLKLTSLLMVLLGLLLGNDFFYMNMLTPLKICYMNSLMWFMYSHSYYIYLTNYTLSNFINLSVMWGEYFGASGISYYLMKMSNSMQFYSYSSLKIFLMFTLIWLILLI